MNLIYRKIQSTPPLFATDCQAALADDNLELCLKLLAENIPSNQEVVHYTGTLSGLLKENRLGTISRPDYVLERNKLRASLLEFVGKTLETLEMKPQIEGVAERILVVECLNSPTKWDRIFPDNLFLNRAFMKRGGTIPVGFETSDIVVFDNLNCGSLLGPRNELKRLADEMPLAHFLYVGDAGSNPFMISKIADEQAIFARTANANSHLQHSRQT